MRNTLTAFIILQAFALAIRLLGIVSWPWPWVLLPTITVAILGLMLFAIGVTMIIVIILGRIRHDNQQKEGGDL